jgi:hypothetical protein
MYRERPCRASNLDRQRANLPLWPLGQIPAPINLLLTWQLQAVVGEIDAMLAALDGDVGDVVALGRGFASLHRDAAAWGTHDLDGLITLACSGRVHWTTRETSMYWVIWGIPALYITTVVKMAALIFL